MSSGPMRGMQPEEYTIVVRGERFVLSRDQIFFDSPNYFTALFAGTFRDAVHATREVTLHRDPHLFKIVQTYLSGYHILPLADNWMPAYMSHEAALKNLLEDARFYTLGTLVGLLERAVNDAAVRKAMSLNDEEDEWQIFTFDETWVRRMTIYGHASAQFYIENAKHAPQFASCPIREEKIPHRERFGTIFSWVQADHGGGKGRWKEWFRHYAMAKVIKKDAADRK